MESKMTCPEACAAGGNVAPDDRFSLEAVVANPLLWNVEVRFAPQAAIP